MRPSQHSSDIIICCFHNHQFHNKHYNVHLSIYYNIQTIHKYGLLLYFHNAIIFTSNIFKHLIESATRLVNKLEIKWQTVLTLTLSYSCVNLTDCHCSTKLSCVFNESCYFQPMRRLDFSKLYNHK